ncbi:LysE family translocator [Vogesella sp. DC21W]|uniref:LysE family translocator n=1 Tax=Vogesella aquatica TaxID=2984206 RepID=A0ABT5J0M2_9NEIS|nr:LysE family translocator [Vogesella aquatica]MDC7718373.1 LysE family translocator [Vogesella aquatica]
MLTLPLLSYVSLMSITPGPNNLMLAASGVNFGFRRSLPHLLGISIGHGVQVLIVALLLGWVMTLLNDWRLLLSLAGCGYLFWLSWQVWLAGAPEAKQAVTPMSFLGAAAFQWVNPKAWVMVVNTSLLFLPAAAGWPQALALAGLCALINFPCICLWAALGEGLRRYLSQQFARRLFNGVMAGLMAATAAWLLWDELTLAKVL